MDRGEILRELAAVEAALREVEARLPAHSVKPPIMQELFALEEHRDALLRALAAIEGRSAPE